MTLGFMRHSRTAVISGALLGASCAAHQERQGSLWSQRNTYRDVIEPARQPAGVLFTLYDARHTFGSTLMGN